MDVGKAGSTHSAQARKMMSVMCAPSAQKPVDDTAEFRSRQDRSLQALRDDIRNLESMQSLLRQMGNSAKAGELAKTIDMKKKLLKEAQSSPPQGISGELRNEVADYIKGSRRMPDGLRPENKERLESFASLARNGMTFTDHSWKDLAPEEAFTRLVEVSYHDAQSQVMYKTFENGKISLATLRPDYLKPLDRFITYSKKGFIFFDKTEKGYVPVKSAGDFIRIYRENPDDAVVQAVDGSYVTPDVAAKILLDREVRELIPRDDKDRPDVIQKGDEVVIGGVVLKRRAD
jgi:hypothetical protein